MINTYIYINCQYNVASNNDDNIDNNIDGVNAP